jgi:hypothetical protein
MLTFDNHYLTCLAFATKHLLLFYSFVSFFPYLTRCIGAVWQWVARIALQRRYESRVGESRWQRK